MYEIFHMKLNVWQFPIGGQSQRNATTLIAFRLGELPIAWQNSILDLSYPKHHPRTRLTQGSPFPWELGC